ncbi:hypothetical protein [Paraburkholderia sediminicola]|uniref:hypothetical protein n=1 Tax=Paraburkholderia sediminicola TaxID=458836 RepID=UPI0038BDCE58
MAKEPQNAKLCDLDEGGLTVHLSFDPDDSPADGKTPNTAVPKVSLGPYLESAYGVKLTINGGSAVFTDPDPNTDGKQATVQTGSMGRGYANFTDTVAENTQTMTATVVTDPEGQIILNGPSDTETFAFKQVADVYGLTFADALANNQPADGTSEDAGRAIVTKNGQPLGASESVIVVFSSSSSSTSFDLTKPYVQDGSTSQKLLVQTHNENGQTIADAYFTDTAPEGVTLTGQLQNDADVSGTQDFAFTQVATHNYSLAFTVPPLANNQAADGTPADEGQIVVTDNGGRIAAPVIVEFTFTDGSAQFVTTGDPNIQGGSTPTTLHVRTHYDESLGKDLANASFTDQTAEGVTLKASLPDHTEAGSPTQDFTFAAVDHYGLAFADPLSNNQLADGSSADEGRVIVTDNGGQLIAPVIVEFTFTNGSAQFVLTGDDNIVSGSTPTSLLVKTAYDSNLGKDIANASFTDQTPEGVTLKASLPDHTEAGSQTQDFTFAATHDYALTFTTPPPADNQAAGSGTDEAQAVVTDNGGQLTDPVIVNFVFLQGSAQFVLTGDDNIVSGSTPTTLLVKTHFDSNLGKDIANASFTDANAEPVTAKAVLQADSNVSDTQDFMFNPSGQKIMFEATGANFMQVSEDGQTVTLVNTRDTPSMYGDPSTIFTAQPYGADGQTVQLINYSNGNLRYLMASAELTLSGYLIYAAPPSTDKASLFQLIYPYGKSDSAAVYIKSLIAFPGVYLDTTDFKTIYAGVSDSDDALATWNAPYPS